jgi:sec-independent protein translocase protein TatA
MNPPLLAVFNLGPMEILLIVFVLVLIFGARKLPELGKGIGEGIKNFKASMSEGSRDDEDRFRSDKNPPKS